MSRLAHIGREERGTSVIEMALVAPLFATFLIGMVDLSRAYSFRLGLEQVVQRSIEKVMQYQENTSTYATLVNESVSAANAAGYSDVTSGDVTVDFWLECNSIRQPDYDNTCSSGQTYARFITVSVESNFRPLFGTRFFPGANGDGSFTIETEAGIRTQ